MAIRDNLDSNGVLNMLSDDEAAGCIRFPNTGIQITFQRYKKNTSFNTDAPWGSIYESNQIDAENFPAEFSSKPAVFVSLYSLTRGCWIQIHGSNSATKPGNLRIYSSAPFTGELPFDISVIAIGSYNAS